MRAETDGDGPAVRAVLCQAFRGSAEADLVDVLRGATDPQISLVAELPEHGVVGHVLFTRVEIRSPARTSSAIGLAPMAVLESFQRTGVGSTLVHAGLAACRSVGELVVVVLGHPAYYPRFGFRPAWEHGLYYGAPGPNPAFMATELEPGALDGREGQVVYHEAFDAS